MRAARIDGAAPVKPWPLELLAPGQLVVVAGRATHEHAARAARQGLGVVARVLDAVPACLQEQALLRIHASRLARGDVEERRIELVDVVERAHPPAVGLAGRGVALLVVQVDVPAVLRNFVDAVPALRDVAPELVEICGLGELTGHADHGDRLQAGCGRNALAAAPLPPRGERGRACACRGGGRGGRFDGSRRHLHLPCGDERARPFRRFAHVAAELRQRRVAVDLDRFDRGAVGLVDVADPGDAGDGIQPEVDELLVVADLVFVHSQLLRQHRSQAGGERGEIFRGGRRGGRQRRRHRLRGRSGVPAEATLDAHQRVGLADEGALVHGELALERVCKRALQCVGPAPLEGDKAAAEAARHASCQRHRRRQHAVARQHRMAQAAFLQLAARIFARGQQRLAREVVPDALREQQRRAGARRKAVAHVRADVAAFVAEQREVGVHAQRPAGADAMALHRGDHRHRAGQRQLEDLVVGEPGLALLDGEQGVARAAGREEVVVAGEDHDLDRVVVLDVREHLLHAACEGVREHVLRVAIGHSHFQNPFRMRDRGHHPRFERESDRRRRHVLIAGLVRRRLFLVERRGVVLQHGSRALFPRREHRRREGGQGIGQRQRGGLDLVGGHHMARSVVAAQFGARRLGAGEQQSLRGFIAQAKRERRGRIARQRRIAQDVGAGVAAVAAVDARVAELGDGPGDAVGVAVQGHDDRAAEREQRLAVALRHCGARRIVDLWQEARVFTGKHHAATGRGLLDAREHGAQIREQIARAVPFAQRAYRHDQDVLPMGPQFEALGRRLDRGGLERLRNSRRLLDRRQGLHRRGECDAPGAASAAAARPGISGPDSRPGPGRRWPPARAAGSDMSSPWP